MRKIKIKQSQLSGLRRIISLWSDLKSNSNDVIDETYFSDIFILFHLFLALGLFRNRRIEKKQNPFSASNIIGMITMFGGFSG